LVGGDADTYILPRIRLEAVFENFELQFTHHAQDDHYGMVGRMEDLHGTYFLQLG
jgi:hypothetical protein